MADANEVASEQPGRPASGDVLKELVSLRARDGMTKRKLIPCRSILALPSVEDERKRRKLNAGDAYIAAHNAIKCVTKDATIDTDLALILAGTLNIDSLKEDLDDRRIRIRQRLFLSSKAFRLREEDAYIELASRLTDSDVSPCRPGQYPVRELLEMSVTIQASAEDLAAVLNLLTLERRDFVRNAISRGVFEALPKARMAASRFGPRIVWSGGGRLEEALEFAISALLREVWPPPTQNTLFSSATIESILFKTDQDPDQLFEQRIASELFADRGLEELLRTSPDLLAPSMKRDSLFSLATLVLQAEVANSWEELFGGPGSGADSRNPLVPVF